MKYLLILFLVISYFFSTHGYAKITVSTNSKSYQTTLWKPGSLDNFWGNTIHSFSGYKSLLHLAGIGFTYILMNQNVDYDIHTYFSKNKSLTYWFLPVGFTGAFGPFGVSAYLYHCGKARSNIKMMGAGCAVFQSTCITLFYVTLLKFLTGRPNPEPEEYDDMKKLSRIFNFGFGREGIFWGWPSGHTATTVAVISTLTAYYPEKLWLKIGGYLYTAYTMIGVTAIGDGTMHWFSDAVAATFLAYAIGNTVGNHYRKALLNHPPAQKTTNLQILPIYNTTSIGLKAEYRF